MYAFRGDRIYVRDGAAEVTRDAEVIENDHPDGHPPYWVRWSDSGEEELYVPTGDTVVEHSGPVYPAEYDARGPYVGV
ncbi:DUF1918 domain-containing protein [Nocardioides sp.]|uniref:DUF1918 domain-containing protein n=1 Tax=Nocardioides sp. TaxID=35761 RepID=UPI003783AEED